VPNSSPPARGAISVERPPPRAAGGARRQRFAFLIHPPDDTALLGILPASVRGTDEHARRRWLEWMHSWSSKMRTVAQVLHIEDFRSATGARAEGWLIASTLTPAELLRLGARAQTELIDAFLEEAGKFEVDIVGLGAFTSVLTRAGSTLRERPLSLTTGNSLTALASVESALHHAAARGAQPADLRCAVIGGAGSVGRLTAVHLVRRGVRALTLIGNAGNPRALAELGRVADELSADCAVELTTDVARGVGAAELVITATSAGRSFVRADSFGRGAIVCDVARPLDVLSRVRGEREDLLIFEGGLMQLPADIQFGERNLLGYPSGVALACMSETIVLALEGVAGKYSIGNRIDYAQALRVFESARKHGFVPYTGSTDFGT